MAIAFRSATTTASLTGTEPTGAAQNDLLVAMVVNGATVTGPSGWTQIGTEINPSSGWLNSMWTIVRGGSAPSYVWGGSSSGPKVSIAAYSGVSSTLGADASTGDSEVSPSVTSTVDTSLLVCGFTENAGSAATAPSGMTGRVLDTKSSLADLALPTAGATGTKTWGNPSTPAGSWSLILQPGSSTKPYYAYAQQ